jgi:hypothetical protein
MQWLIDINTDCKQYHVIQLFQICINLANEQMQSYTNEYIFMKEQEDCLLEGVPLVELNYKNNQPIIDAFLEVVMHFEKFDF